MPSLNFANVAIGMAISLVYRYFIMSQNCFGRYFSMSGS
jgi:hypothetical protein